MDNTEKAGGTRYSTGKIGGWWYVPMYGLKLVAQVANMGAAKYAPMDWRNGQSFSTLWDCLSRHFLEAQQKGLLSRDPESGLLHLAHMGWNLLALLTFIALERWDLDDVTVWEGVSAAQKKEAEELAAANGGTVEHALRELKGLREAHRDVRDDFPPPSLEEVRDSRRYVEWPVGTLDDIEYIRDLREARTRPRSPPFGLQRFKREIEKLERGEEAYPTSQGVEAALKDPPPSLRRSLTAERSPLADLPDPGPAGVYRTELVGGGVSAAPPAPLPDAALSAWKLAVRAALDFIEAALRDPPARGGPGCDP